MRRALDVLRLRLRSLFGRGGVETEMDRELQFHLDKLTEENMDKGMPEREARDAARRAMGGVAQIEEQIRDTRRVALLDTILGDLRYSLRKLAHTPGFTAVIVLTLALSIGANSAIFSVIQGVLLRPLPYPHPDRLVRIYFQSDTQPKFPLNPNDFRDFRERNRTFDSLAAMTRHDLQLSAPGSEPVLLRGFAVTAGFFRTLGIAPAMGRDFDTHDELPQQYRVAILSDRLWRSRFGADPKIVGRAIDLNAEPFTVIGVMPAGARHPGNNFHAVADGDTVDLWTAFGLYDDPKDRGSHYLDAFGRMKPGVTEADAMGDLRVILDQIQNHATDGWRMYTVPLFRETVGKSERMLFVLLGAVGLLLLIACVNAANLLLARSSARVREIAVRSALGAARARIVRQLLTESVVIAFAGAALGTLFAYGGVRALVMFLPADFPRASEIRLDGGVFGFTMGVAVLTGLLFGLVPALTASRVDLQNSLRESGRGLTGGTGQLRLRNVLVVAETGLACVLLIAAGLMLHSFVNLLKVDPGFKPQRVLTASISLPRERYPGKAVLQFVDRLMAALESQPGIQFAGAGSDLPWTGYDGNADGWYVEGHPEFNNKTTARYHGATADYFQALGVPLLAGRFYDAHDTEDSPTVLIINETMAHRYWPNESALGKRITFRGHPEAKDWMQVVGIVRDIKDTPEATSIRPAFWFPWAQNPDRGMQIAIRSSSDASTVANQLRSVLRSMDPDLAIADLRTMDQIADSALATQRFALFLVGLFAALALVLAVFGTYGVISYSVNLRMHEYGLRMALGAKPGDLLRMILKRGMALAVAGAAAGLIAAVGLTKLLGTMLYGMGASDPVTDVSVAALVVATTAFACYVPARRAASADPMRTLRAD